MAASSTIPRTRSACIDGGSWKVTELGRALSMRVSRTHTAMLLATATVAITLTLGTSSAVAGWSGTIGLVTTEEHPYVHHFGTEQTFEAQVHVTSSQPFEWGVWWGPGQYLEQGGQYSEGTFLGFGWDTDWSLYGTVTGSLQSPGSDIDNTCGADLSSDPQLDPSWPSGPDDTDPYSIPNQWLPIIGYKDARPGSSFFLPAIFLHLRGNSPGCDPTVDEPDWVLPSMEYQYNRGYSVYTAGLRLPTSGPGGPQSVGAGGLRWHGTQDHYFEDTGYSGDADPPDTYRTTWTYDLTYTPDQAVPRQRCKLMAKSPQRATRKGIVATVVGGDGGCSAQLETAKLKIAKKVYTFVKKRPSKNVAAGGSWRVGIPYSKAILKKIRQALKHKKSVKAKVEFTLGSESAAKVIKVVK